VARNCKTLQGREMEKVDGADRTDGAGAGRSPSLAKPKISCALERRATGCRLDGREAGSNVMGYQL